MQNNLLAVFKAITPDNIKNIKVIDDSMRIFIELLTTYSNISIDISNLLSENTTLEIEEELPKIYLYDYYSMIENLKNNKEIVNKFRNWDTVLNPTVYPDDVPIIGSKLIINYFTIGSAGTNLSVDDSTDNTTEFNINPLSEKLQLLEKELLQNNSQNYFINRKFKESKGLKKGIKFIYDILNEYLVNIDERRELEFNETGNPFELSISGSIDKDIYRESVEYLSHPLGFVYDYKYISELRLDDNYYIINSYIINQLEVRCLDGNIEKYTKEVQYIIEKENYIKILFKDGYYLLQENGIVRYYDNLDYIIKLYPVDKQCSIYLDYNISVESTLNDNTIFTIIKNLEIDEFPEAHDEILFFENLQFKINYIVGTSIIGEDLITRDTDSFETLNISEDFLIETF